MANFICEFEGVRGRKLKLYDTKIVIITKKTVGSLITGNFTDGEKTIFLRDIVGVQHKKSGLLIGYLQFETPSMQMNNKSDNFFSENTFTYENEKNGITNELIEVLCDYIVDRIEELKYGIPVVNNTPNFESMKVYSPSKTEHPELHYAETEHPEFCYTEDNTFDGEEYLDILCPNCGEPVSYLLNETNAICPWCNAKIDLE